MPEGIGQLKQLRSLNLTGVIQKQQELPGSITLLPKLRVLNLSHNKLSKLPECVGQIQTLRILDLSNNEFTKLPKVLSQLKQLQVLNILSYQNSLHELSEDIVHLQELRVLKISFNTMPEHPHGELTHFSRETLPNLYERYGDALYNIPKGLGYLSRLSHLKALFLGGLYAFPKEIIQLTKLQKLELKSGYCLDNKLPEGLGQLKQLRMLNLSGNELVELPKDIAQLRELRVLDVSINMIGDFPEIGQLQKLQELYLYYNSYNELPEVVSKLTQLQKLNVGWNSLDELPEFIGQLRQLKSLDLTYTGLYELPASIEQLKQLQILHLPSESLIELPKSMDYLFRNDDVYGLSKCSEIFGGSPFIYQSTQLKYPTDKYELWF